MTSSDAHVSIGELCDDTAVLLQTGPFGSQLHAHEYQATGAPVVPTEAIGRRRINKIELPRISSDVAARLARHRLSAGDILFARRGVQATGSSALIENDLDGAICGTGAILLRVLDRQRVDPVYLSFALSAPAAVQWLKDHAVGAVMPNLNTDLIRRLRVPVPDVTEQRAIAAVLGALDDKIDLNRRMSETLEETARALFKSWFVDFDPVRAKAKGRQPFGMDAATPSLFPNRFAPSEQGEIPAGWRAGTLGDIAIFHNSKRVPLSSRQRDERRGNYPYYGAAGVVDHIDGYLFDGTYILVGEDGSVVNDDGSPVTQYVWGKFWVNNHAHVLTGAGDVSLEWLLLLLRSRDVRPYVTGAVQPKLSQGRLRECPVVVPATLPLRKFSEVAEPLFAKVRQARDESRTLAELRDYLLPKLLSGEVRVRDAEKLVGEAT